MRTFIDLPTAPRECTCGGLPQHVRHLFGIESQYEDWLDAQHSSLAMLTLGCNAGVTPGCFALMHAPPTNLYDARHSLRKSGNLSTCA